MTKFRISDHLFPIESFRRTDLTRNHRLCLSCDINAIGDLFHCILFCPTTKDKINCLYEKLNHLSPQLSLLEPKDKLKYLLSCSDKETTLLCMKPLSDIVMLHRQNYDFLKPILLNKIKGNLSGLSTKGISYAQFISDLKIINCLFNPHY